MAVEPDMTELRGLKRGMGGGDMEIAEVCSFSPLVNEEQKSSSSHIGLTSGGQPRSAAIWLHRRRTQEAEQASTTEHATDQFLLAAQGDVAGDSAAACKTDAHMNGTSPGCHPLNISMWGGGRRASTG